MPKRSRSVFSVFLTLLTIAAHGQKKLISYDQAFKNKETKIFAPLPTFVKWIDDDHLVIKTSGKMIGIDLKTKQSSSYTPTLLTDTLPGAYASNYKGMLRIVHGAGDNNAHPQNILQLIDRLQDLNRSFEFMLYPGERHGFHGKKWLHNKNECARFYYQYLLNKKVPASVWE